MLIPKIADTDRLDLTRLCWILIVEKEVCMGAILAANTKYYIGNVSFFHQHGTMGEAWPTWFGLDCNMSNLLIGLVLTHVQAKGYPDIATRGFLRQLANHAPHVPTYAFVDLDPDGIAIMSTYKYGSYRLAHENVAPKDTPALSLPNIRWLGVKRHHMSRIPMEESGTQTGSMPELQGLMRLTARDRTKAIQMLEWDLCSETGAEPEWRRELQTLLILNVKAEIQILEELPGGVVSILSTELDQVQESEVDVVVETPCSDDGLLF